MSPIWHAVAWIGIYIAAVQVGDMLSVDVFGLENSLTAPILVALSFVLVLYVRASGGLKHYGIRRLCKADFTRSLYYLPLLVMGLIQLVKGPDTELGGVDVVLVVVLMLCVGFLEELIFRGFLYRAILRERSVIAAVVISGVTFGIGHIVNLTRGYTGVEQLLQIVVGISVGIVLALLFAVTGTIMPGVVFHIMLNISGSITAQNQQLELYVVAATVLFCVAYAAYLVRQLVRPAARADLPAGPFEGAVDHARGPSMVPKTAAVTRPNATST